MLQILILAKSMQREFTGRCQIRTNQALVNLKDGNIFMLPLLECMNSMQSYVLLFPSSRLQVSERKISGFGRRSTSCISKEGDFESCKATYSGKQKLFQEDKGSSTRIKANRCFTAQNNMSSKSQYSNDLTPSAFLHKG